MSQSGHQRASRESALSQPQQIGIFAREIVDNYFRPTVPSHLMVGFDDFNLPINVFERRVERWQSLFFNCNSNALNDRLC